MPNICNGIVSIEGKPENIEKFCKLFFRFFEEDELQKAYKERKGNKGELKFEEKYHFARTNIDLDWEEFKKEYLGDDEVEFSVEFAWSCHSCLIEGYPQQFENCVTLEEGCKMFDVDVYIETEEEGMGFEEEISYTKEKGLIDKVNDMPKFKCEKCGEEQIIPSERPISEEECLECGETNWVEVKSEEEENA